MRVLAACGPRQREPAGLGMSGHRGTPRNESSLRGRRRVPGVAGEPLAVQPAPAGPLVPAIRTDEEPGENDLRGTPLLAGLMVGLLAGWWIGWPAAGCLAAGTAGWTNALLSWRSGVAIPLFGVRWLTVWRRERSPWWYWGAVATDVGVGGLALAAATTLK